METIKMEQGATPKDFFRKPYDGYAADLIPEFQSQLSMASV